MNDFSDDDVRTAMVRLMAELAPGEPMPSEQEVQRFVESFQLFSERITDLSMEMRSLGLSIPIIASLLLGSGAGMMQALGDSPDKIGELAKQYASKSISIASSLTDPVQ